MLNKLDIYDNKGESLDRYTIVIDNCVYGMSHNPLSINGVNTYLGEVEQFDFINNVSVGSRVDILDVLDEVQQAIAKILMENK